MGTGPERSDIEGFALRLLPGERHAHPIDLLFASTGSGPVSRFVLTFRRPGVHGTQTTLLPLRATGPLLLRLEPVGASTSPHAADGRWPNTYELSWALGRGPWEHCGGLAVDWTGSTDVPERFDPIRNPLPGTMQYPGVRWLREPSYALARRAWPGAGRLSTRERKQSL